MYNPLDVFRFIAEAQARGERTALVTIVATTGASTRNPGAHLAVSETGAFAGSISGGCIETAVAGEAVAVIGKGVPRTVRYGKDSPYIDIRLPCGGGVDLLFTPLLEGGTGAQLVGRLEARQPIAIDLSFTAPDVAIFDGDDRSGVALSADGLRVRHVPPLRLAILGNGAAVAKLAEIALACDALADVYTPDRALAERCRETGAATTLLLTPDSPVALRLDRWTAASLLFHDHEWEPSFLARALESPAFFIGAMGSHATHATRSTLLRQAGVEEAAIGRIVAPIGLIPSMRDPETLAVSVLAQVVGEFHRQHLAPAAQVSHDAASPS